MAPLSTIRGVLSNLAPFLSPGAQEAGHVHSLLKAIRYLDRVSARGNPGSPRPGVASPAITDDSQSIRIRAPLTIAL